MLKQIAQINNIVIASDSAVPIAIGTNYARPLGIFAVASSFLLAMTKWAKFKCIIRHGWTSKHVQRAMWFYSLIMILIFASCGDKKPSVVQSAQATHNPADSASAKTILFFGDSLTAGYGLDDPSEAFPGVVQHKIDSAKLLYKVVNAGVSGETTAGGKGRIGWVLKQKVDVFVLELGANDGLRGIPVSETTNNLQSIIDSVKARYPDAKIVLAGMQVPPNMGAAYANGFKAIFPALAAKNKTALVPFLLKGVGGVPALNQHDGIHPTAEGAKIVGNNVWQVLKGAL